MAKNKGGREIRKPKQVKKPMTNESSSTAPSVGRGTSKIK